MFTSEFLSKSLTPEIFWIALSSIGTWVLILITFLFPLIYKWKKNQNITKLIEAELLGNMQIIKNMISKESITLPNGIEISAVQYFDALLSHIDLRLWYEFRYQLAVNNTSKHQKYQDINRHAEEIVNATMEPPQLRLSLQINEADNFIKNYKQVFGSIDT